MGSTPYTAVYHGHTYLNAVYCLGDIIWYTIIIHDNYHIGKWKCLKYICILHIYQHDQNHVKCYLYTTNYMCFIKTLVNDYPLMR